MDKVECPECGEECVIEDCYDSGTQYTQECEHCGKNFVFETIYDVSFNASKAPCLNDESDHDWKPVRGVEAGTIAYHECRVCGERKAK